MGRFRKLWFRYRQFGSWRLVREYWRLGLVWLVFKSIVKCALERKPFKTIYPIITARVDNLLRQQYRHMVEDAEKSTTPVIGPRKIWFCWLQGMENAPIVVRKCYESICRYITDREIVVVTSENWRNLIDLPEDLVKKHEAGIIPHAHFSDLIRLELLVRYGGTWIDSTVLMTDPALIDNGVDRIRRILDADLFFFQYKKQELDAYGGISNWFISAQANNSLLRVLQKMLYQYWHDYDCVVEYYIFHLFFGMIATKYPKEVADMPYEYSVHSLYLERKMSEPWDEQWVEKLTHYVCFHKLNYRVNAVVQEKMDSFHNVILMKWK